MSNIEKSSTLSTSDPEKTVPQKSSPKDSSKSGKRKKKDNSNQNNSDERNEPKKKRKLNKEKEEKTKEMRNARIELPETELKVGNKWFYKSVTLINEKNELLSNPSVGSEVKVFGIEAKRYLVAVTCATNSNNPSFWIVGEKGLDEEPNSVLISSIIRFGNEKKFDETIFEKFFQTKEEEWKKRQQEIKDRSTKFNKKRENSPHGFGAVAYQPLQNELQLEKEKIGEFQKEVQQLKEKIRTLEAEKTDLCSRAAFAEGQVKIYEKFYSEKKN
jgi:hypothetical protein